MPDGIFAGCGIIGGIVGCPIGCVYGISMYGKYCMSNRNVSGYEITKYDIMLDIIMIPLVGVSGSVGGMGVFGTVGFCIPMIIAFLPISIPICYYYNPTKRT